MWVGTFQPAPPGGAGHMTAIDECRERIAAGEIFQANLCLRLEAEWKGDPLDLFAAHRGHARAASRRARDEGRGARSAASPPSCSCAAAAARW